MPDLSRRSRCGEGGFVGGQSGRSKAFSGHGAKDWSAIASLFMKTPAVLLAAHGIENVILLMRGHRVMLDRDLAALYGVTTSNLNKAVKRNPDRFPEDFMFQITVEGARSLRFYSGIIKRGQHHKYLPHACPCKRRAALPGSEENG